MYNKIMYFMDNYVNFGGAANTILQQAVLMKKTGKQVAVVVSKDCNGNICKEYLKICADNDIEIIASSYCVTNQPEDVDIISVISNYDEVKECIRSYKPDIVHSVQLNPTVELVCRELDIPHIMNIYQAIPEFWDYKYIDIFPKYHICDSNYFAAVWHQYMQTESICIRTTAVRGSKTKKTIDCVKTTKFICVGGVFARKNQFEVIKAFESALNHGLSGSLRLYGQSNGAYADKCREYIAEKKLGEKISLEGFCQNMSEVYQENDVLICGSRVESYPNIVSEALANGVVVVSTPVAGVPEVIRDGENGYLCNGYSSEDIAEGILKCCDDIKTGRIKEVIKNGYETYEEEHSEVSVIEKLDAYYERVKKNFVSKPVVTIAELESKFNHVIKRYYDNRDSFSDTKVVEGALWRIYYMQQSMKDEWKQGEKDCYIWGAGKYGQAAKEIIDVFFPNMHIKGFLDSRKRGKFLGYEIYDPEMGYKNIENIIFVSLAEQQIEVMRTLERNNYTYRKNYFLLPKRAW